jgi:hypothetical protein
MTEYALGRALDAHRCFMPPPRRSGQALPAMARFAGLPSILTGGIMRHYRTDAHSKIAIRYQSEASLVAID